MACQGPADAAAGAPPRRGTGRRRFRVAVSAMRPRPRRRTCAAAVSPWTTPDRTRSSTTSTPTPTRCSRRSAPPTRTTWPASTRNRDGHHVARQGAQRRLAPGHGARPEGRLDGRGHREARWRVPGHRGSAARLRRPPGDRHAAGRVRCHRYRRRPGHAGLPARVRDPIRRVRLPRLRPDRLAGRQAPLPQRGPGGHAGDHPAALRRRDRRGRAPLRVTRGLLRPHRRAPRGDAEQRRGWAPHDSAGHRLRRPGRVLRAEAPLLGQG